LKNIKTAQEEVFVVSGRNLNLLNNAPATEFKTLIIESTQKEDNLLLESIATGLEYVFMQMTPRQAMVNKLAFEGLTQKDIGTQLGVSQQNIQKTLQAGGYKMVLKYQKLLEKSFEVQNLI
jgi:DNA-binding NarL/FixJ family response regulator